MKKILSFLIFSFIISAGNKIFSQKISGACQHKEITRELCAAADTIARFMGDIKKNSTGGAWEGFMKDAILGPAAAFSNFGDRGEELRETFTQLGKDLDIQTLSLITAIDPNERLSGEQLRDQIISEIYCYYDDPKENDLTKLIKDGGGPTPQRFADGPCENTLRSCVTAAASTHMTQLMACGFGSGNILHYFGGWWGLGAGLFCLAGIENTYNNAKMTCIHNYCDCAHCIF